MHPVKEQLSVDTLVNITGWAAAFNNQIFCLSGIIIKLRLGLCVLGGFRGELMYFRLPQNSHFHLAVRRRRGVCVCSACVELILMIN